MAITAEQIEADLRASIETEDNTIDTSRGPVPALYIRPQSGQLAAVSTEAEEVRQLFTLQFPSVITSEEAQLALGNFGSVPGLGSKSRHVQYFMRFTRPNADITVSAGQLVSNIDGSLVYKVLESATMLVSAASAYYNPSRNTYEVSCLVEALGSGTDYELAAYRVNTLLTPIVGIDSTENRTQSKGGTPAETIDQQSARLKQSLLGLNKGAPGGIKSGITNQYSDKVTEVITVEPFDTNFHRITAGNAIDVYIWGDEQGTFTQTTFAVANQTQIVLSKKPVTSVTRVTINGISETGYTLLVDSSFETGYSLSSVDAVIFDNPLLVGDEVVIEFSYNSILETLQNDYFNANESTLFNVDMLLRIPFPVKPKITMTVRSLPSYEASSIETQIRDYLATFLTPTAKIDAIYPEIMRQEIRSTIPGIQSLTVSEFRRSEGSLLDIEPIFFTDSERSIYDADVITLKVT
jgi:hypothetical protein